MAEPAMHPHIQTTVSIDLFAWSHFVESFMSKFDLNAPAELFPSRNRKITTKVKYRRFDHAADAIRFAMEEMPEALLLGAYSEIDEERLGHKDIRALYEAANFPAKQLAG
jgi:hypothetical protein